MVGGGRGAFIGAVHRIAAAMDQQIDLVCGAFSSDPGRSKASGADLFLPANRCYGTYQEMIKAEAKLPEGERMDFVAIVTPNHMHFPPAKMALENGFHVLSDKPATLNLAEAKKLAEIVKKTGQLFALTHNYTGYPLVKSARTCPAGKLGRSAKSSSNTRRRLATDQASGQNRPPGALTRSAAAPPAASVTSARTRRTLPNTSPA
jgi:predicted dehydrogenase